MFIKLNFDHTRFSVASSITALSLCASPLSEEQYLINCKIAQNARKEPPSERRPVPSSV